MSLNPGTRLGPYEILAPLGAGGMGEVHRARDSRLGRDVAIKALPAAVAQDPERLARFEREAKLLALLSHANVGAIYGLEEVDGARYLVLELVEGETLAARLRRGPLSLEESLEVCREVAAALESAHEAGVIHRDLKPGNIMLAAAGGVKVLDFGLAKGAAANGSASDPSLSASPTMTYAATGAGVVLGTAAYMSPEQARGKPVDKRTDIWSLGCVLYECLTGRQPFEGETVSDLIARILERQPDFEALPRRTPARAREILARCLEKDVRRRLRDAGDARIEIEAILAAGVSSSSGVLPAAAGRSPVPFGRIVGVGVVALVAAGLMLVAARLFVRAPAPPVMRLEVREPVGAALNRDATMAAISPDGNTLVFVAADSADIQRLWLRPVNSLAARLLPGTEGAWEPFWSPDSRFLGFFADGKLKKIAAGGGSIEVLCDAPDARGGSWGSSGVILFSPASQGSIFRVSPTGGTPQQVTVPDSTGGETSHRFPRLLPDGDHFIYSALSSRSVDKVVWLGSLRSSRRVRLLTAATGAEFARPGWLLYVRGAGLVAQRFDTRALRLVGDPVALEDRPATSNFSGAPVVTAAANGTLAYVNYPGTMSRLVILDRSTREQRASALPPARYEQIAISPDERLAMVCRTNADGGSDLWIADPERGTATRFTAAAGSNELPLWSPDGRQVVFMSSREGQQNLYLKPANGAAPEVALVTEGAPFKRPHSWSRDGRYLVFGQLDSRTSWDLWVLPLQGDRKPVPYMRTPSSEERGEISPDGRWMAYDSDESGRLEIYVQSFPAPGTKYQLTTTGGFSPRWSPDGKTIAYGGPPQGLTLMAVDVQTEPAFRAVGKARELGSMPPGTSWADMTRDLSRVYLLVPAGGSVPPSIVLVSNWAGEPASR